MTLILATVGAALALAVAVVRMWRRPRAPAPPRDVHRGDWPPDQMAR